MKSASDGNNKTRVNINIFLSHDLHDDGLSDNEVPGSGEHQVVSLNIAFVQKLN